MDTNTDQTSKSSEVQLYDLKDSHAGELEPADPTGQPVSQNESACENPRGSSSELQSLTKKPAEHEVNIKPNAYSSDPSGSIIEESISSNSGNQIVDELKDASNVAKDFNTQTHSIICPDESTTIEELEASSPLDESSAELDETSIKTISESNIFSENSPKKEFISVTSGDPVGSPGLRRGIVKEITFPSFEDPNSSSECLEQEDEFVKSTSNDATCGTIEDETLSYGLSQEMVPLRISKDLACEQVSDNSSNKELKEDGVSSHSNALATLERKASSAPDFTSSLKEKIIGTSSDNENVRERCYSFPPVTEKTDFNSFYLRPMILAEFEHYKENKSARTFFSEREWECLKFSKLSKISKGGKCKNITTLGSLKNDETSNSVKRLSPVDLKTDLVLSSEHKCCNPAIQNNETNKDKNSDMVNSTSLSINKEISETNSDPVCVIHPNEHSLKRLHSKYATDLKELIDIDEKRKRMEENSKLPDLERIPDDIATNPVSKKFEEKDDPFYSEMLGDLINLIFFDFKINKWTVLESKSKHPLFKAIVERHFEDSVMPTANSSENCPVISNVLTKLSRLSSTSQVYEDKATKETSEQKKAAPNSKLASKDSPSHSNTLDREQITSIFSSYIAKAEKERKINDSVQRIKDPKSCEKGLIKATRKSGRWTMVDFESNPDLPWTDHLEDCVIRKGNNLTDSSKQYESNTEKSPEDLKVKEDLTKVKTPANSNGITVSIVKEIIRPRLRETLGDTDFETDTEDFQRTRNNGMK